MEVIKSVVQITRQINVSHSGVTGTYPIGIGKLDNGRYYVVRTNTPSFFVDEILLFHALDKARDIIEDYHKSIINNIPKTQFVTGATIPESNLRKCRYCGQSKLNPCMSTRDMEDTRADICQAALLVAGGGEYSWRQAVSNQLFRTNLLPHVEDFKTQIQIGHMGFVNLANKWLRKEQYSL